jgi:hypothetical protein
MKITVDIDCTPQEARTFLGLPDVQPMQDVIMKEIEERMVSNMRSLDATELMRHWMPSQFKGFEQMQDFFAKMAGGKTK